MPKSSTPASKAKKMHLKRLKSIEFSAPTILFPPTESIRTNFLDDLVEQGKQMSDEQFDRFIKGNSTRKKWNEFCTVQWWIRKSFQISEENWSKQIKPLCLFWQISNRLIKRMKISINFSSIYIVFDLINRSIEDPNRSFLGHLDQKTDSYWRIWAQRTRVQLEEKLNENRQVKSKFDFAIFFFFSIQFV